MPPGVEEVVLRVRVELPPAVTELGLKEAVAPEGSPLALSVSVCADPLVTVVLMVEVPLWPWTTDTLFGLALIAKSSGRVTVSATAVLWVTEAPVPVTVTV